MNERDHDVDDDSRDSDDDYPWVLKLRADTTREDVRSFVARASGQQRPIITIVTERNTHVDEIIVSVVQDALNAGVKITIQSRPSAR